MRENHGESYKSGRSPEYAAWVNMIQRCENPRLRHYDRYGGRGVRVCTRWRRSFPAFLSDVGRRPTREHSLDRYPDRDGNYEPGNVRWATEKQQQRNRITNRSVTARGATKCLEEWAEETGIKRGTLAMRLSSGMNPEQAISRQVGPKTYQFQGQNLTARAIAAKAGIPHNSLLRRIKRHGSVVAAIAHWKANGRGKKTGRSSAPMTRRTER